jgi:hypothetical protein
MPQGEGPLSTAAAAAENFIAASHAKATLRAYESDWRAFSEWC